MKPNVDPRAKALIFDIDGTIADTMEIHFQSWQKVMEKLGGFFPEELFYQWAGMPTAAITCKLNEKYGTKMSPAEAEILKEKYFLDLVESVKPVEAVVALVKEYHGVLPMGCGTGGRKVISEKIISGLGLSGYFDVVVSSDDVTHYKPSPETFLLCAQLMNVEPQFCQVFEDGDLGIEAALNGGMMVTDVRQYI